MKIMYAYVPWPYKVTNKTIKTLTHKNYFSRPSCKKIDFRHIIGCRRTVVPDSNASQQTATQAIYKQHNCHKEQQMSVRKSHRDASSSITNTNEVTALRIFRVSSM